MKKREAPGFNFDEKLLLHFPIPQNNITQVELLKEIHKSEVLKEILEQRRNKINWLLAFQLDYELLDEWLVLQEEIQKISIRIDEIRAKVILQ